MKIYKIIAKDDMAGDIHTWTKGLDYELTIKENFITITSNEGELNYANSVADSVLEMFELPSESIAMERIKKTADDLGLQVSFGNPPEKSGILNTDTGELTTWDEVADNLELFFGFGSK